MSKVAAARRLGVNARRISEWHRRMTASTALAHHAVQVSMIYVDQYQLRFSM